MIRYEKVKNQRAYREINDTNDCSVISIAIACRMRYIDAWEACNRNGRRKGRGMHTWDVLRTVKSLGFEVETINKILQKNGSRYTPKTIGKKLKRGYYLCFVHGHVFAVVNGDVEDWAHDRNHRIEHIVKVIRPRG